MIFGDIQTDKFIPKEELKIAIAHKISGGSFWHFVNHDDHGVEACIEEAIATSVLWQWLSSHHMSCIDDVKIWHPIIVG